MFSKHSNHQRADRSQPTDADLFMALQTGQLDSLSLLYDRHAALVYGIAFQLLGNAHEAEDLTQDIFLALSKGCSYDPKRGTLRTFLGILTRSRAIDRLRSRHRIREKFGQQPFTDEERTGSQTPIDYLFQVERSQEVQAALSQLPPREQQVLKMAYYEGLSQSEIASRLNVPLGTIKSQSRRGLLKLRHALSEFIGMP